MALGTNRIRALSPTDCAGRWGYPTNQVFGWTLYDSLGGAFTLEQIKVWMPNEEVVHNGTAFQGDWAAGSTYNPVTGVTTVIKTGGYSLGTLLRFRVRSTDGTNSAFSSFYVGIGDPPGTSTTPEVGQVVFAPDGSLFEIIGLVGQAGDVRYRVRARDRTKAGVMILRPNEFSVFPAQTRLDPRIILSE